MTDSQPETKSEVERVIESLCEPTARDSSLVTIHREVALEPAAHETNATPYVPPTQSEIGEMVASEIAYLKHKVSVSKFLVLISKYCSSYRSSASSSFEEMILNGNADLFLEHADAEYEAAISLQDADISHFCEDVDAKYAAAIGLDDVHCSICEDWAERHKARIPMLVARKEAFIAERAEIRAEEARGLFRDCMRRGLMWRDDWLCVHDIVAEYPSQFAHAVRMCIRGQIDPTALGRVETVLNRFTDVFSTEKAWNKLVALYNDKGLGSWPAIEKLIKIEELERAAITVGENP